MGILLLIFGLILCLNSIFRILLYTGMFLGLKGAYKWTSEGHQITENNSNLEVAKKQLIKNLLLLIVGIVLVYIAKISKS